MNNKISKEDIFFNYLTIFPAFKGLTFEEILESATPLTMLSISKTLKPE
jgi:hypothetical protein